MTPYNLFSIPLISEFIPPFIPSSLLPLLKLTYEKAKKLGVTGIAWNPK
jgi:hypothetical protein